MEETKQAEVKELFFTQICELNDNLNVSRKMNPEQIAKSTHLLADEYYDMPEKKIRKVFRYITRGIYELKYDKIDISDIGYWFDHDIRMHGDYD